MHRWIHLILQDAYFVRLLPSFLPSLELKISWRRFLLAPLYYKHCFLSKTRQGLTTSHCSVPAGCSFLSSKVKPYSWAKPRVLYVSTSKLGGSSHRTWQVEGGEFFGNFLDHIIQSSAPALNSWSDRAYLK